MVKEVKKIAVKEITKKIENADLIIFSSYKKLTVAGDRELRRKLRSANAEYKVYKNTLTKLALKKLNIAINEKSLEGPTSFIFSKDPVAPAKVLVTFVKGNEAVAIKGGIYLGKEISVAQIKELASLPSREELLSKLVYVLQSPITRLVNVAQGPLRKVVYALNAIKEKK
jgi:large subunit ribosomal protein L10